VNASESVDVVLKMFDGSSAGTRRSPWPLFHLTSDLQGTPARLRSAPVGPRQPAGGCCSKKMHNRSHRGDHMQIGSARLLPSAG
jgi:hypothetical protein